MFTLQLADGSRVENLRRLNPSTFILDDTGANIYARLSDSNLAFATLLNGDELDDVLIDYTLQNYSVQGGTIRFRIAPLQILQDQEKHKAEKERLKRNNILLSMRVEKEMGL